MSTVNLTDATKLLQLLSQRDMRFVDALLAEHRPDVLEHVVGRWVKDPRAWAWEEANRYFLRHINSLGHEVVVKRLIRAGVAQRKDRTVASALGINILVVSFPVVLNAADNVRGMQLGVYNAVEKDLQGVQVGLFNSTTNGFQIGLLNYNENGFLPWFPLFNF